MTVTELRKLIKGLPGNTEVMQCDLHGKYSKQGIHEYKHLVSQAKYKKVKCDGWLSDGFGGKYQPLNNFCWKKVKEGKAEIRKGLFLDLPYSSEDLVDEACKPAN